MKPREEWTLPTRRLGRRVLVFDRLPSTNTLAAELAADPANDGVAVLADEQTAGRGQHGRTWTAPPRSGVLLSLLLFPPPPLRRPPVLTAWAAVAVCATVRLVTGVPARIKWPNDVLLCGRKTCGILIEQGRGTVVGVGLNVRQTAADFEAAGLPEATALGQFTAAPPDTYAVARLLLERLDAEWDALLGGDLATLEACWKWHVGLLGKPVRAECHDGVIAGRLHDLTFDGVELEGQGGGVVLPPERVLRLRPG
jgi:BirA family transcriptional regulator, biotin operon repressor / biotin---[acetyl-CoA-carboxylase] ligase